jgi:hypothetical protein
VALTALIFLPVMGFVSAQISPQSYFDTNSNGNSGLVDGIQVSVTGWYISSSGPYYQTSHVAERWAYWPIATYGKMDSIFSGNGFWSEAYTDGNRAWSQSTWLTHWASSYATSGYINQVTQETYARETYASISR